MYQHGMTPQPVRAKFTDESDKLILEDELQRIVLVGEVDVQASVTGVIIAVKGSEPEDNRGKFHVTDYCYLDIPEQSERPVLTEDK